MDKLSTRMERAMAQAINDHYAQIEKVANSTRTKADKAERLEKLNDPKTLQAAMLAAREAVKKEEAERLNAVSEAKGKTVN